MGEVIDEEIDEVVDAESPLEEISQALTRSYEPEALVQNARIRRKNQHGHFEEVKTF